MKTYVCEYCGAAFDYEKQKTCPCCGAGLSKAEIKRMQAEEALHQERLSKIASDMAAIKAQNAREHTQIHNTTIINNYGPGARYNSRSRQRPKTLGCLPSIIIAIIIVIASIVLVCKYRVRNTYTDQIKQTEIATEQEEIPEKITGDFGVGINNVYYRCTVMNVRLYQVAGYQKTAGDFDCVSKVPIAVRLNIENICDKNIQVGEVSGYYLEDNVKIPLKKLYANDNERDNKLRGIWLRPGSNEVGCEFFVVPVDEVGYGSIFVVYNNEVTVEIPRWREFIDLD